MMLAEIATLCSLIMGYAIAQHVLKEKRLKSIPYITSFISGFLFFTPFSIFLGLLAGSEGFLNRKPLALLTIAGTLGLIANYIFRPYLNFI